jgi:hypothetical protein
MARDINQAKITVQFGYKFEKGVDIFKEYINHYFKLKSEAEEHKNEGKRTLAKLMLNSLYGRFGLKYQDTKTEIVKTSTALDLILKRKMLSNIIIDKEMDLELVKYNLEPSDILKDLYPKSYFKLMQEKNKEEFIEKSVPIAAMITYLARMYMHPFLYNIKNECYYTYTDSAVLKYPLDPKYVGNKLGQFKYLGKIKKGYFLSPKLYCLILEDGNTIIKSKGIPSKYLTEQDFIEMLYGINKKYP